MTDPVPSIAQVLPATQRGVTTSRGWFIAGIIAVVVIAVTGVVAVATRSEPSSDPLFVLPPAAGWTVTDGAVTEPGANLPATAQRFITDGNLYGRPDGDGYGDLRSVAVHAESPLAASSGWEPAETVRGDAWRRVDSMTFAIEEDDGTWTVVSSPDDLVHAYEMLTNDVGDLTWIASFAPPEVPDVPSTSFLMTSPDGTTFTVETSTSAPLFDVATFAERIEPVEIDGTDGWIAVDEQETGTAITVAWSPEDGRTVHVRSIAPSDVVVDAARALSVVSSDDWTAAFPGA
jgi:hypothetical protein